MSTTKNSKNQIKRTIGLVLLLIGLVILVIVPSSSGSGPAPLAFGNKNSPSTRAGRSEARQPRQPTFNTIGYHVPASYTVPVDLSAGLIGHWPLNGNADDTRGTATTERSAARLQLLACSEELITLTAALRSMSATSIFLPGSIRFRAGFGLTYLP